MKSTYRAVQVSKPGTLELVERPTPAPGRGEVLLAVEACLICGVDANDIDGADPQLQPPRVPGHEVVGRIAALGEGVPAPWSLGQWVGVGRLGGHCNACAQCRQGRFQLCRNQPFVGASCDGGYTEMMLARATGLVSIPDELNSEKAAPILCAGIAIFNALKKCGAEAGDTVACSGSAASGIWRCNMPGGWVQGGRRRKGTGHRGNSLGTWRARLEPSRNLASACGLWCGGWAE